MTRGELRIYLGAAPGVGKTVAMLEEGRRRAGRGTDVVVGYCETHDRPRTAAALEGLEIVPRTHIQYREAEFEEMDLDAVLERRPQVVLVDELAHTNAPGMRNAKRWQDVEELLDAGINVITTVNVQHLESLGDVTYEITGVLQRERVPDAVVRAAEQIELVDMTPEALRRRLAHGNVYKPHKVDAALANYFRPGNLGALRELALLWLANRVDDSLERYRSDHGITRPWATRDRILVALSGGPEGATLLRRAARLLGKSVGGELHAVYVAPDDGLVSTDLGTVRELRRLTQDLGGTFHTVSGSNRAQAVVDYARAINAHQVVVGISRSPRWRRAFRPGTGEAIIAASGDSLDVHVVSHELAGSDSWRTREPSELSPMRVRLGFLLALLGPALLTTAFSHLPSGVGLPLIVLTYLVATVVVALAGGLVPALTAAVVSSLCINWFFTPPLGTFTIAEKENIAALLLFVVVAALVSFVVHRSAHRAASAHRSATDAATLIELSNTLLGSTDQTGVLLSRVRDMFGQRAAAIVTHGKPSSVLATTEGYQEALAAHPQELNVEHVDDEHDLVLIGAAPPANRQGLLQAFAAHAAALLHREQLEGVAAEAEALASDNRARTALLSAVSHDLRTPLAGIKAAIGSLRSTDVAFTEADRAELLEAVETSADRLNDLIANLLDMSRVQVGALVAHPRPTDLAEVITPALRALAPPERFHVTFQAEARYATVDAGLLERVIGNIAENALRYQPAATPVLVQAQAISTPDGDRIVLRIVDHGAGVSRDQLESMFRPFQRHGDSASSSGVGLGLAVARGLTEAMGGSVHAEATAGGGVTMVLSLLPVKASGEEG